MFQKCRAHYFIIPLIAITIAYVGRIFNEAGMNWYKMLNKPTATPPDYVFGIVWTVLYALIAWAVILFWNKHKNNKHFWTVIALFILNAIFNLAWSFFFFYYQSIGMALIDCILVGLTAWALIYYMWPISRFIALLLLPYVAWTTFATYLNMVIWKIN